MKKFNYEFDSSKCEACGGKCCTGESGFIWINDEEIEALANKFELSKDEFKYIFTYKEGNKISLKEKPFEGGWACVFFDEKNRNCSVYELRPKQCRTFPFWDYFLNHFDELEKECIGIKKL